MASCAFVGSATANVGATGSSQLVSGCQNGENWIQPPITASTVRTPTGTSIVSGPSLPWCAWRCSRTNAVGSPGNMMKYSRNV